jgi:hypothetical protein
MERAFYVCYNVGMQPLSVAARDLRPTFNVGVEENPVEARDLALYFNIGIQALSMLARAIYLFFSVTENAGEGDGLEMLLVDSDNLTVEAILRGK